MYKIVLKSDGENFSNFNKIWFAVFFVSFTLLLVYMKSNHDRFEEKVYKGYVVYKYDKENKVIVKLDSINEPYTLDPYSYSQHPYDVGQDSVNYHCFYNNSVNDKVSLKLQRSKVEKKSSDVLFDFSSVLLLMNFIALFVYIIIYIAHVINNYKLISTKLLKFRKTVDPYGEEDWDD